MSELVGFRPDWTSAPGDTISDILEERSISTTEFARLIDQTPEEVSDLLQGRSTITLGIARELERILGASVEFWMTRDYQYREGIAELTDAERQWINELPVSDMIKFGWLKPIPLPAEELVSCLKFFNVPSVEAWHKKYAQVNQLVTFRTSPSYDSRPGSIAAWLRRGEIEAEDIECWSWDPEGFKSSLERIRPLTRRKDPNLFIPQLQRICAENGVAVAVVRAPAGCSTSGATNFIDSHKAILMLSYRYLSHDQFWFSFFHEAGHLLLHNSTNLYLEDDDTLRTSEEQEADDFAESILIPPEHRSEMLSLRGNSRDVIRFAVQLGVAPGIVVGQLQHYGKVPYNWLNGLKRRFPGEL